MDGRLEGGRLGDKLQLRWESYNQARKQALALQALVMLKWEILAIFVPRLSLVAFNVAQPFLIANAVTLIRRQKHTPPRHSQKPFYLLLCIQRWLTLVMDLIVAGMAILLITLAVVLRAKMHPGLLGLSLVNLMSLGSSMASFINFWTALETSLGAVARIGDFVQEMPCEVMEGENAEPGSQWPDQVSTSYRYFSSLSELMIC